MELSKYELDIIIWALKNYEYYMEQCDGYNEEESIFVNGESITLGQFSLDINHLLTKIEKEQKKIIWIKSQNKNELFKNEDINHLYCYEEFGGKPYVGIIKDNVSYVLGYYSTIEKAEKVLNLLQKELDCNTSEKNIFQMPKDDEVK